LNGRAGLSGLGEVVADLCLRANVEADVSALTGAVSGYVVDAPSTPRDALEPLMAAYDFVAAERAGDMVFFHRSAHALVTLAIDDAALRASRRHFRSAVTRWTGPSKRVCAFWIHNATI
jgi:hypothetical protein